MAKCKLTATQTTQLQALFEAFNSARTALFTELSSLSEAWQTQFDEASESWQDSEAGGDAQERLDALNALTAVFENEPEFDLEELS